MIRDKVEALLCTRRLTSAEIAAELGLGQRVVQNALYCIAKRRKVHSAQESRRAGVRGGRGQLRYWLDGAPPAIRTPRVSRRSCPRCGLRAVHARGLCRPCSRSQEFFESNLAADAALVARMDVSHLIPPPRVREPIHRVYDGVEFEVTMTGKDSLFPDRPGMGSVLASAGCLVMGGR